MNGIVFNENNGTLIDQVKKNELEQKKVKVKIIIMLILSNAFIAFLFSSSKTEIQNTKPKPVLIFHENFKILTLNINPLVQVDNNAVEQKITLINDKNNVIAKIAFLHEEIKNSDVSEKRRFNIEVPENEILKISNFSNETLIAIPYLANETKKTHYQGSQYEINL